MSDRIYIQGSPDVETSTWCRDRINDDDREYVAVEEHARIIESWKAELEAAKREIAVLRQYGNKDCTGQADAELARLGHPAFKPAP